MKKIFCTLMILALMILPKMCGATQIQSTSYKGEFQFTYPTVYTSNTLIDSMINEQIREEVKNFFDALKQPNDSVTGEMSYEIPCDRHNIFSVILTEYIYTAGAAHPSTFKRALNFDKRTGKLIKLDDLKKVSREYTSENYSPSGVTRKLKAYAEREGINLYSDFKGLEKLPENFYFDENFHLHFIFQQYEVAPYAAGIIDLDATV